MKFSLNRILTVTCLLALASMTMAAPLQDVSITSVDLSEETINAKGDEHLFVTVTRIDDLVDDDGSLLAERIMAVRVTFDVLENQLMCNGRPVDIGVSNIQVEAQMAANPDKLMIASEEDAAVLADTFDVGLATVEVTATILDELQTDDGMKFRRINVQEKITEINGEKVVQTEAGQQILDVFDNGSLLKWAVDPLTGFMLPGPAIDDNGNSTFVEDDSVTQSMADWWNDQTSVVRGFIAGTVCAFFLSLILAVRQLIVSSNASYDSVPIEESSDEQIWEKKQEPPAYEEEENKPFLA
ncbi:hypothetical protein K501DRAFT_167852 [Backusella circina FSU 941]|nr:hypothetical protein K501DRAFT_167852 [Backusella circina FSU 941]